ncbi:MAG: penicillin-binding transpeptidase domain-containing protein [Oscillospiraceae bacterium]|nr:penicillin-binding transpeptidase domain-containing protein [Oscillospiraceae bacterium]
MNLKKMNQRTVTVIGLFLAVLTGFAITLVKVQIIDGPAYARQYSIQSSEVPIPAARGVILDRNGIPLVENRSATNIVFEHPFFPSRDNKEAQAERNELLAALISLFEAHGAGWIDNLPIQLNEKGQPEYIEDRETDIAWLKSAEMLKLNDYATAQNCVDALIAKYALQDFELPMARGIASVQYEMARLNYRTSNPYTFAKNVTDELISKIKENSGFYRGVTTEIVPIRTYTDGTIAPHVLGRVAAIGAEDYKANKDNGYQLNDEYGSFGIERAAESWLRGRSGTKLVTVVQGEPAQSEIVEPAEQGNTVVLTLDRNLQALIQERFPKYMNDFKERRFNVPAAGAVVVIDVNTFEILACVSYPGYDVSNYQEDLSDLLKNPEKPLWDRALLDAYEPGSTIKPSVALAAMQEGFLTKDYTFRCTGTYNYLDTSFRCGQVQLHGGRPINVVKALVDSCNSFFYEMGRMLGYERVNSYRLHMGLGQKTGVEIPEAMGVMDSPERRAGINQMWYPGYNIQTAIGQNNLFTPIQMAVYTATIANNGTRYRAHFIQSVRKAGTMELVKANLPEVLGEVGVEQAYYDVVREGMYRLGTTPTTTAGRYFKDLPVEVGAKTGTSQVVRTINGRQEQISNGIFISFAPFDKPEIAVIAIGEGCRNSEPTIPIVRDVYEYYFGSLENLTTPQLENMLLG